jgi:hypothetical protein
MSRSYNNRLSSVCKMEGPHIGYDVGSVDAFLSLCRIISPVALGI